MPQRGGLLGVPAAEPPPSANFLEFVARCSRDAVLVTEADASAPRIVYVNEAFSTMTGYAPEEVIGRTPRMLRAPETDPAETRRIGASLRRNEAVRATLLNRRKTGERFWVELDIAPVVDAAGVTTHWVSVQRDVTARINTENKLQTITAAAPIAIMLVDQAHRVVEANAEAERIFGHKRDALIGQPIAQLIPERFRARHADLARESFEQALYAETRRMANDSILGLRADGAEIPISVRITQTAIDGEQAAIVTVEDVSSLIATQAALREKVALLEISSQAKDRFLSVVSHELRTPLNAILGFSEILLNAPGDEHGKAKDYARHIHDSGAHLHALIENILIYTAARDPETGLPRAPVDAADATRRAMAQNAADARARRVELRAEIAPGLPPTAGDDDALLRVLSNLIRNAIEASPADGVVRVCVEPAAEGDAVAFAVVDEGPGLPPDVLEDIDRPFLKSLLRGAYAPDAGLGLGLPTANALLEKMASRLLISSEPSGGSRCAFILPRCAGAAS